MESIITEISNFLTNGWVWLTAFLSLIAFGFITVMNETDDATDNDWFDRD